MRRVAAVASLLALIPVLVSYVQSVTQPSNSSVGILTVEWIRDHGGAGLISSAEALYYSMTAPSKGGPTLKALPQVGVSAAAPATGLLAPPRARPAYRPARIRSVIRPALPGEGVWRATRAISPRNSPVLLTTYRTDPNYPRLVAGVAWIDAKKTAVLLYPGRREPSVPIPRGTATVPQRARHRLLATFNSGFKISDARGGFALHGHTYAPMQDGVATLVGYRSGRIDIQSWRGGATVPAGVSFARQNLPLIVDHSRPNPNLSDGPQWGATLGNAIRVWRSGVGVDRRGNLLYAASDKQTVGSLAAILIRAGAVRAMELDINSYWTSFISYRAAGALRPSNLLSTMARAPTRYLTPDDRDFFAVYQR
ncbi:MAG: hypothetical protein ACR2ND_11895 [Solirubrobacteraceae bacterium]